MQCVVLDQQPRGSLAIPDPIMWGEHVPWPQARMAFRGARRSLLGGAEETEICGYAEDPIPALTAIGDGLSRRQSESPKPRNLNAIRSDYPARRAAIPRSIPMT
jgi:hypothetical protein